MICWQGKNGALLFANEAWYVATALPREPASFEPEAWTRVVHPDDTADVFATVANAVLTQAAYAFEYRVRAADDSSPDAYRWFYARATPQMEANAFAGWVISVVDIQETRSRETAERELLRQAIKRENEFKALGEAVPQILWTAGPSGALDWYNQRYYDYTGQSAEEAAGWGWQAVHHPIDFPEVMERWPASIASGVPFEMEHRIRRHDGEFRWFLTRAHPHKDEDGRIVRWFGTNTDIHEQRQGAERSKRIAQTLQEVFLPEHLPAHDSLKFDAIYVPAESDALVGGDWYDAFNLPDGRVLISIGDVAGHGLDAAVIAGRLRQTIFTESLTNHDPAKILRKADDVLRAQTSVIATALIAIVDLDTGETVYASAGHPAPIASSPGSKAKRLADGSAPLGTGFTPGGLLTETHSYTLVPDSSLVLYTDGLIEFTRDVAYGENRLLLAIDAMNAGALAQSAREIHAFVLEERAAHDDIALLLARFKPSRSSAASRSPSRTKHWRFHSSDPYSARSARHELMTFLKSHATDFDELYTVENIIGELLANTVEHAPGMVETQIDWTSDAPILTMRDTGPGVADGSPHLPASDLDENGRGLFLIRNLSADVSIQAAPGFGTEFVVVLPLHRSS